MNASWGMAISDTLFLAIIVEERLKKATKDNMFRHRLLSPPNPFPAPPSPAPRSLSLSVCVKAYLVSLGPPQRKEAGEEELAPADDGSQAPVEASHACVRPVLSASLLSLYPPSQVWGRILQPTHPQKEKKKKKNDIEEEKDYAEAQDLLVLVH